MERYEAYKDSGVEWIGEIPEGWNMRRAKTVFTPRRTKGNDCLVQLAATQDRGMIPQSQLESVVQVSESADLSQFRTVHVNDFVISLRSFQGGFELSGYEGVCSPAYQVFFGNKSVEPAYCRYLFKSDAFISKMNSLTVGIREGKNIQFQDFANSKLAFPPIREQQAIADYLDAKTGEVDGLIAGCEREVELLQEYRKSVISEAVTKGLDPTVPMKDSGIEWIGEIPNRWNVFPLRRCIVRTGNGITRRGGYDEDGTLVLKLRNINNGTINYGFQNRMRLTEKELCSFNLDIGDFLFVRVNGSRDLVGKSAIFEGYPSNVAFNDHIIRISFNDRNCIPRFMLWYLQSVASRQEIDLRVKTSAGQFTVSSDDIKECLFVMPPLQEQREIASYLDSKTAEIDALIKDKQTMADKLRGYRKSLISEAVTGKFKVPGI